MAAPPPPSERPQDPTPATVPLSESPELVVTRPKGHRATGGASEPDPLLHRQIAGYRILSRLGEGGFGVVYLAEQTEPVRRRVALKVIKPGMDSRAVLARFEAERQALALMDHPGIARIFDAGVIPERDSPGGAAGRPYFVMEFVPGEPITRFTEQERLGIEARVRLMIQVCSAVQHAHMKGIIHRDLKPSNILVELLDGVPAPKIIDFGVAKALRERLSDSSIFTERGAMVGTPEYMSPEQARGSAVDVDTRADVYSLGAILYELLTGATPLDSRELRAAGYAAAQKLIEERSPLRPSDRVVTAIRDGTLDSRILEGGGNGRSGGGSPPSRTTRSGGLPRRLRGDLDWIVMRCLEKERSRRYDSASALARDLERYLADEPVEAGPPSAAYRTAKFVRRHKAGVAASAVMTAALVIAAVGAGWGYTQAQKHRTLAEEQARAAMTARDEAESVTAFLSTMLESGTPEEAGRDATVREALDRASATVGSEMKGRPLVEARLRHTMGNAYGSLGLLNDSEKHLSMALEIRRRELGPEHADTLRVLGNVAGLRHHQGRYEEAELLLKRALEGWRKAGEEDSPTALGLLNNLAQTYARQGRHAEAINLQKRVVDGQTRVQGADHPHTLGAVVNLASLYENERNFAESEKFLREALEGWTRAHGAEHPGTLLAMSNLAGLIVRSGRAAEAEPLHRRVFELRTRVLGPDHPDTITAHGNLGWSLLRMGKLNDAEPILRAAWDQARRVLGESHPDTITTALNLMSIYETAGWPEAVRSRVEGLLPTLRSIASRENATADQLNSCAWMLLTVEPESIRDPATALKAAQRACEKERALSGAELWQYLDTLALAEFRAQPSAPAQAAEHQREAISLVPPDGREYLGEMNDRLRQYLEAAGLPAPAPAPAADPPGGG